MKYKCARCAVFYDSDDSGAHTACMYHNGRFQEYVLPFGQWSCCKRSSLAAQGCMRGSHMEDVHISALLNQFAAVATDAPTTRGDVDGAGEVVELSEPQASSSTPPKLTPTPGKYDEEFITYEVQFGDTLAGIAIRFHTNAGKLKLLNRLVTSEEVHSRKTILIPKDPTKTPLTPPLSSLQPKSKPVDQFMAKTGASKEEALFYLEDNDWVVNHAVAAMVQDKEWDEEEGYTHTKGGNGKENFQFDVEDAQQSPGTQRSGCFGWFTPEAKSLLST